MVYLLVFWSGFAGLVYEIVWIKRAALGFGSSSLALSTVLAVFFLGLGLGSYGFGHVGRRVRQPLLWCAGLELALGLNGFLNPLWFDWAERGFGMVYKYYAMDSAALLGLRAALVALVLLPPTVLMGGTLPLFCRQLVRDPTRIAGKIGRIYGVNTLGATVGCALAGFVLLPELGVMGSTFLAATVNLLVGAGFFLLSRAWGALPVDDDGCHAPALSSAVEVTSSSFAKGETKGEGSAVYYGLVALLFFLIGAVALANELVWARFLGNFIRNSVYTYTITLTVVLAGTVLGSVWGGPRFDRVSKPWRLLAGFAMLQALSAMLVLILTHLPVLYWLHIKQYGVLPFFLLMLPPSVIAGACFPLVNRLAIGDPALASLHVGRLTAINILGCIVGSVAAGFWLLPELGLDTSIYATSGLGIVAAIIAMVMAVFKQRAAMIIEKPDAAPWLEMSWIGLAALAWMALPEYAPVRVPNDFIAAPGSLVDFAEGYNSTLAVIRRGDAKIMLVNQLWQGTSKKNHQIMVAHVPMLHYPDAKDVLVIGLGVGQTASRFLMYPLERLDIVDIEPRLFEFTRKNFDSAWMNDHRVSLLSEDGRGYVKHTQQQYDLVSVEVGQLYRPGVDVFYTREFYQEAKARLTTNGMIVQFVPVEFLRAPEFASIINTFLSEFPQARLWFNGNELLLMGFNGAVPAMSQDGFLAVVERNLLKDDLSYAYWGGPKYEVNRFPVFLGGFLAEGEELRDLAKFPGTTIYSDDLPKLAYEVSNFNEAEVRAVQLAPIIEQHLSPLSRVIQVPAADGGLLAEAELIRKSNIGDMTAANLLELIEPGQLKADPAGIDKLKAVLAANPNNIFGLRMMSELLVFQQRDADALPYLRQVLELDEQDSSANQKLGLALLRGRQLEKAVPYLLKSLAVKPNEAETINSLAVALINLGRITEAVEYFRRAALLEPNNAAAQRNLRNAETMLQRQLQGG